MNILEQKKVNLKPIITHKLPLSEWKEAFDLCEKKQCGKVLLSHTP
jgi:L-iditol 2-dehydrogenase